MVNSLFASLHKNQEIYARVLVEEFIREAKFLADVISGRAEAKGDFTDKISNVLSETLTKT